MRHTAAGKAARIRLVEGADLSVRQTVRELRLNRSTGDTWCRRDSQRGQAGLTPTPGAARRHWNRIPPRVRQQVVEAAAADPERSPRERAWQVTDREGHCLSESSASLQPQRCGSDHPPHRGGCARPPRPLPSRHTGPTRTARTCLQVVSGGWSYRSTVLDDDSRYILAWTLRPSMPASDVTETLDLARAQAGVDRVRVVHRPRLLSDNGPCYLSPELADSLDTSGLTHTRGAPSHLLTPGKIERDQRSLKNVVTLEQYCSPWDLERALARFVDAYHHRRYQESLQNVTPADVYHGRRAAILARRDPIKQQTRTARRGKHLRTPPYAVHRRDVSRLQ